MVFQIAANLAPIKEKESIEKITKKRFPQLKKKCYNNKKNIYLEKGKKYRNENKDKIRIRNLKYRINNKESIRRSKKIHYSKNKESIIKKAADWNKNNKKRRKEILRKSNKKNIGKNIFKLAKRRAIKKQAIPPWADMEKIKIIYAKAKWLESITGFKYHVDHVIPLQGKNVCGLHVWENLQILEASENIKKGNKYVTQNLLIHY